MEELGWNAKVTSGLMLMMIQTGRRTVHLIKRLIFLFMLKSNIAGWFRAILYIERKGRGGEGRKRDG